MRTREQVLGGPTTGGPSFATSGDATSPAPRPTPPPAGWCLGPRGAVVEALAAAACGLVVATELGEATRLAAPSVAVWAALAYGHGGCARATDTRLTDLIRGSATLLATLALLAGLDLLQPHSLRGAVLAVLSATLVSGAVRLVRRRQVPPVRTLLVGDGPAVLSLVRQWTSGDRVRVVGTLAAPEVHAEADLTRSCEEIAAAVDRLHPAVVVVVPGPSLTPIALRRLTWCLERKRVQLVVAGLLDHVGPHRISPETLAGNPVIELRASRESVVLTTLKSAVDRMAGLVLLVVSAPVLAALALAVKLDSPGPAFFVQRRVGLDGAGFTLYKLRTMCVDAEDRRTALRDEDPERMLFKMEHDPRVTRVGRLLRLSSLDELPQLLNVVQGHMSLIGPRPALPEEVARYDIEARRRLVVKPGMTGLWQVSGRSDLSWEESQALDLEYVDNWRFSQDLLIAAKTFRAVVGRKGAY